MLYLIRDTASLTEPSDALANNFSASSDIFPFSIFEIFLNVQNFI